MNALYPARSDISLTEICERLVVVFELAPFKHLHRSDHLETAQAVSIVTPFQVAVTQYFYPVTLEDAERLGPPDYWNLAWRTAVGFFFNYQVRVSYEAVTRNKRRKIARKLRSVFTEIRLHGEPRNHII